MRVALAVAALLAAAPSFAQDPGSEDVPELERPHGPRGKDESEPSGRVRTPDDFRKPIYEWENLTGDWGGLRPRLIESGIIPELVYTVELFSKVAGGTSKGQTTRLLGNLDLTLTLVSEGLGLWPGGTLFVYFDNLVGDSKGVNAGVGGPFADASTLNAPRHAQLSAYAYQQRFFDDRLSVKLGKHDANAEFLASEATALFLNGGVSPPPNVPMPTFPDPSLGFVVRTRPLDWLELAAGVYGGDAVGGSFGDAGLFSGETFSIAALAFDFEPCGLPGTYRVGAWLRTVDTPEVTTLPAPRTFGDNEGFYLLFDQALYAEPGKQGEGLAAFFELSWAPPSRNEVELWVGGGLVYTGLLPGRPEDQLGFSVQHSAASPRLRPAGLRREMVFEWSYLAQVFGWLSLQPDLQWFVDPGGAGRNALVLGLRTVIEF